MQQVIALITKACVADRSKATLLASAMNPLLVICGRHWLLVGCRCTLHTVCQADHACAVLCMIICQVHIACTVRHCQHDKRSALQRVVQRAISGSEPLAAGAHGKVYAAPLAIKMAQGDYTWCLQMEAAATAGIDSPYICRPLFMSRGGDRMAMAMPLAKLGSLSSYLR